jgi:hypothetical protein
VLALRVLPGLAPAAVMRIDPLSVCAGLTWAAGLGLSAGLLAAACALRATPARLLRRP